MIRNRKKSIDHAWATAGRSPSVGRPPAPGQFRPDAWAVLERDINFHTTEKFEQILCQKNMFKKIKDSSFKKKMNKESSIMQNLSKSLYQIKSDVKKEHG